MAKTLNPGLLLSWLTAGLRATAYVLGPGQLKMYVKSMGEVLIDDLPERVGTPRKVENDAVANIQAFAKVEDASGAYDPGHVAAEKNGEGYTVTFASCPYAAPCGEILGELIESGKFTNKNLPCLRSDVAAALITESTGRKCRYELSQFAPGFKCVSQVELL